MHGIGKGRKTGSRNKSKVERLVDMIVMATDADPKVTVDLLQEHWDVMQSRIKKGQDPIRNEFLEGNKVSNRYSKKAGLTEVSVKNTLGKLMEIVRNPPTVSKIDKVQDILVYLGLRGDDMHSTGLFMWWLKKQQELAQQEDSRPRIYAIPPELKTIDQVEQEASEKKEPSRVIIIDL